MDSRVLRIMEVRVIQVVGLRCQPSKVYLKLLRDRGIMRLFREGRIVAGGILEEV